MASACRPASRRVMAVSCRRCTYTLAAGNLHLMTSIVAWGAFVSTRDEQKVIQDLRIRQKWDEFQKRDLHGNTESHSLSNGRVAAGLVRSLDL